MRFPGDPIGQHLLRVRLRCTGVAVDVADLLRCPRCEGGLTPADSSAAAWHCKDCGREFPTVAGIPLLLVDPHEERRQWSYQLHEFAREVDRARDRLLAQLSGETIPAGARARMQRLHEGLVAHRDGIVARFEAAGVTPVSRQAKDRDRVPGEGTVTAYYDQMFRDWVWGDAEISAALAQVVAAWPSGRSLGRCLVLGAGAGRLPCEVVRAIGADVAVALDLNPLPYLVLAALQRGQTVALAELPQQARTSHDVLVPRTLSAERPPVELSLVFADGLRPPVAAGTFDTVMTPWFIDQVPPDAADLIRTITELLPAGGRWLNHGPLIYHPNHTRYAHRYRVDELRQMLVDAGWTIDAWSYEPLPYMHSPVSSQGRTEHVLTFVATRGDAVATHEPAPRPAWLDDPDEPVPRLPGLDEYAPPHPMFAAVIALVDGRRSIRAIAAEMVARHGLPADAAEVGVTGCLQQIARALGIAI